MSDEKLLGTLEPDAAIGTRADTASAAAGASLVSLARQILETVGVYEGGDVLAVLGALDDAAASGAVTELDTIMAYVKQLVTEGIARDGVMGASDDAAAEGAVTESDTGIAYLKQLVTEGIARDALLGALDDAAAAGAVTDADTVMAYIKQLVTEGIARDAVLGALDDAAADGAVTDADTAMAYIKQLITEGIARDAVIGALDDAAADTADVTPIVSLIRHIAEAVNNGTGSAIGENLSLVDIIGAFDGGGDPQGDIFQALGVDETNSVKALIDGVETKVDTIDGIVDAILADLWPKQARKQVDYDGQAGNGAAGTVALFTVTGAVKLKIYAICTDSIVEAEGDGTTSIGISGSTQLFVATTTAADIDAGEVWHDASPDSETELDSDIELRILGNGNNVIQTITTRPITDGTIVFCAEWTPITADGDVAAVA